MFKRLTFLNYDEIVKTRYCFALKKIHVFFRVLFKIIQIRFLTNLVKTLENTYMNR